ncbi:MAG: ribonuclease III domain-containing protein [Cyanobacteriota bacterium]|nr:ribonuclease III domain-containing protein [Cyanobacteriota bacterium]
MGLGIDLSNAEPLDLGPIDEALSHSSAGLAHNHERLEFLGDAVLRLAASEFLRREHPQLPVGRHAALRAQLVSDRWLAAVGEQCGIQRVWRLGAMAAGDRAGRATVLAELTEALIGGLYLCWGRGESVPGSLAPVLQWLTPHWRRSAALYLAHPELDNWKSALQEWSQGQGLGLPHYQCQERSQRHGDPERFHCRVSLVEGPSGQHLQGEGLGPSRRTAEQQAARNALELLRSSQTQPG